MSHWTDLRQFARERSARLRATIAGVPTAAALLAAAEYETGIKRIPVPAGDPLLDGGDAVYDPEPQKIWYNDEVGPELAVVYQAHEYAHVWLNHAGRVHCNRTDLDAEIPEASVPVGVHRVQGYGPKERRERDANVFAREFLLPTDLLRQWFADERLGAPAIAARVGVPLGIVFHQLAYAILIGDLPRIARSNQAVVPERPLDASQRLAAEAQCGPVLVEAGPGTGKTRTLVGRVQWLLDQGADPASILALTYSNKAAEEMRERVARAAPGAAPLLWMGTFHAFGLELLRKFGTHLGLSTDPPVQDPVDAMFLLERELPALGLNYYQYLPEPTKHLKPILSAISRAKDELASPAAYAEFAQRMRAVAVSEEEIEAAEKALEVARVYTIYQARLERDGLLDFGDLIARAVRLLREPANGVRDAVRATYQHILIDEYQDVNRASAVLLREIAGAGERLWVVGDARQSVYRFRGAAPVNMQLFAEDFPGARVLRLSRNYRSQPAIVDAVSRFAAAMPGIDGVPFTPWEAARPQTTGAVRMEIAAHGEAEAEGIAREALQYNANGVGYRDQAVLCRSHTNLARIAEHLERHGVPVIYLGDLFERPEIRDLLALLSLACHGDGRGLVRVARFPEYQIPLADVQAVLALAHEHDMPFPAALSLAAGAASITLEGQRRIALLATHLEGLCYGSEAWTMLSRYLFERSAYLQVLLEDTSLASRQRRLALYRFLQFAYEQRRISHEGRRLERETDPKRSFLRFVRRLAMLGNDTQLRQLPDWASDVDAVRLLTVHASKGLEFPVVFVPTLAAGKFPANRQGNACPPPPEMVGIGRDEKIEHDREEECLLFVAISRAQDVLCLSRAVQYGKQKSNPSKLLARLDSVLPRPSGATTVTWAASSPGDESDTTSGSIPVPSPLPVFSARVLDTYLQCPRKYYYEEVLHLSATRDDTAYLEMHTCVYRVLRWMVDEGTGGRTVDATAAADRLAQVWAEAGPKAHPYEAIYRAAAEQLVARAVDHTERTRGRGRSSQPDWVISFPYGRVTVTPDHVEVVGEGSGASVVVQRMRTGRPSSAETAKPIYGLYHAAAEAAHPGVTPRVEVVYLAAETIDVVTAKPQTIRSRAALYGDAIEGILQDEFPARVDDFLCPRCAHYFICPHAEDT
ncbi:MAG: UvrD-helicase domain-containing protein [Gemmatimonadaceae bacterium]